MRRSWACALVDIGGGTTDLAVFANGAIRHTAVIPIAGDQVTNDIAVSMRTRRSTPRTSRSSYACALSQLANPDETIEVPSVGDRPARRLARQTLAEIVEPRYEELFGLVREELRRSGFEEVIAAGIVLTGGSAKMEGAIELAEEVFHVPVRLGLPQSVQGLSDVVQQSRFFPRAWGCCSTRATTPCPTSRALPGRQREVGHRPDAFLVPGQLLKLTDQSQPIGAAKHV